MDAEVEKIISHCAGRVLDLYQLHIIVTRGSQREIYLSYALFSDERTLSLNMKLKIEPYLAGEFKFSLDRLKWYPSHLTF